MAEVASYSQSHDHDHHGHTHDHSYEETQFIQASERQRYYDLLEKRNKRSEITDPEVEEYFRAKTLFQKGNELALKIPDGTDEETLRKYEKEIFESTKYLVDAFLADEKATEMTQRIISLAQQYEKLLKLQYGGGETDKQKEFTTFEQVEKEIKDEHEERKALAKKGEEVDTLEPEFTKESLMLVVWLLYNGKRFQYCIQTLSIALNQLEPSFHPRLLHLRAMCNLANGDYKQCIKDLERLVSLNPKFVDAYNIQGSIHMQQDDRAEAVRVFKNYVERANKDSFSYSHALYTLSVLTIQNATATATSNRKQALQNLRTQQAYNYYEKAKEAEKRFEYLYGRPSEMTDVKRTAITLFETKTTPTKEQKVEKPKDSMQEAEKLALLQQLLALAPNEPNEQTKKCNNCGNETRKDEGSQLELEKKNKLLVCAACLGVYYCSKECQKKDWKIHKQQCNAKTMK